MDDFYNDINLHLIEREVTILKKLQHPFIIKFIESFSDENTRHLFIVLEISVNGSLESEIMFKDLKGESY
jgi:serine/threonine protein kinase